MHKEEDINDPIRTIENNPIKMTRKWAMKSLIPIAILIVLAIIFGIVIKIYNNNKYFSIIDKIVAVTCCYPKESYELAKITKNSPCKYLTMIDIKGDTGYTVKSDYDVEIELIGDKKEKGNFITDRRLEDFIIVKKRDYYYTNTNELYKTEYIPYFNRFISVKSVNNDISYIEKYNQQLFALVNRQINRVSIYKAE